MSKCAFYVSVLVLSVFCSNICAETFHDFDHKGGMLKYANPKYVANVTVLTSRRNRHTAYITNINGTNLHSWDNNVTISLELQRIDLKSEFYKYEVKLCDSFKYPWVTEWIHKFTDIPLRCPIAARHYHFKGIEWPPKNLPLLKFMPLGNYRSIIVYHVTDTKEKIIEMEIQLRQKNLMKDKF